MTGAIGDAVQGAARWALYNTLADDILPTVTVIATTPHWIAEHLVCSLNLLEARGALWIAIVRVRVILPNELSIGRLDLLGRGVRPHPECLIKICHGAAPDFDEFPEMPSAALTSSKNFRISSGLDSIVAT